MENQLYISPSPHIHSGDSIEKNMYGVLIALVPALLCSFIFFGLGAIIVTVTSVVACMFFEYIISRFLMGKKELTIFDGSAILTGVLLAFNVPSNLPIWILVLGALFAIGVGKMSFGGLGNNVFNPALVGRVFLLISFPVQMTTWPVASVFPMTYLDAETAATPLALIKSVVKGAPVSDLNRLPDMLHMAIGMQGGSLGEVSAIALLLGFLYMLRKKIITWHIPIVIFLTVFVFGGALHLISPSTFVSPITQLLTGGLMLGAIFMATDYVTSPMSKSGKVFFAIGIGLLTIIIRSFGAYPEGVSFAILIMNAVTPLINIYCKPKHFGDK